MNNLKIHISKQSSFYRPDIDGLRAFAVMGVVVFHAMPNFLKGGFVGVDIFFVISGFLITLIIAREMQVGTFSFRSFYARRIRRIFPALFVTLAASLLFGLLFLYPSELSSLSAQALSAAAFVANIYFWMTTSYFSESSGQVALLHLWTLGLEEQYYLVWPLTLYLLIRIAQLNAKYLVLILLLISFAINIKYYRWQPEAAFFLPPARFWEFFVGSALALFSISDSKIPPVNDFFREVISSVSFVVLVSTFFWIDDLKFPGWQALAPVLSTAFLIWTGPQTFIARRVLSNHAVVWVGLISYPLYLYHWPLLIFFESNVFAEYKIAAISVSVFLSILFAAITYKYVEVPIRRSRTTRNLVFLVLMGTAIAAIAVLIRAGYLQGRIQSNEVEFVEEAMSDWAIPEDNYRKLAGFELLDLQRGDSNILVIGDSHASQYYSWFDKNLHALSQQGLGVQFATYGGCPLLPEVNRLEAGYGCPQFYDFALRYAQSSSVQFVIFSVWWEHYFGLRNDSTDPRSTLDADLSDLNTIAEEFGKDLDKLVQSGKKVAVLLSNPTSSSFHPGNMISRIDGGMKTSGISRTDFLNYNLPVSSIINMHLDRPGVQLIDTTLYYCDQDYCPAVNEDGVPIYKDSHHLRSSYVEQHADFLFEFLGIAKPDSKVQ